MTYSGDIRLFYDPKSYPLLNSESRVRIFNALRGSGVGFTSFRLYQSGTQIFPIAFISTYAML